MCFDFIAGSISYFGIRFVTHYKHNSDYNVIFHKSGTAGLNLLKQ